jgi:hypothetical protein
MNNQQEREGGVLFVNNRKQQQNHPDFTGNIRLSKEAVQSIADQVRSGVEFPALDLSAWKKISNGGRHFISVSAKKPYEKGQQGGGNSNRRSPQSTPFSMGSGNDLNDEIPF